MDPFQKLPSEVRLNLLLSASSLQQAVNFTHASPALFRQRDESKIQLVHQYIEEYLDHGLIQDALAVIMFPKAAHEVSERERVAMVEAHLHKWGAKDLSDPTQLVSFDVVRLLQLESICRRLKLYIDDYLSKATHPYLPRACRWLPRWSHQDFLHEPTQDRSKLASSSELRPFDLGSLTRSQRRRLFQAFLRYELLCKIYGPVGGVLKPKELSHDHGRYEKNEHDGYIFDQRDPFRYWDWRVLYRYEQREPEQSELQLLPCVREYILALYGALIADQVQVEVPIMEDNFEFENAPFSNMGGFPDYDPDSPWEELHHLGGTGWSDQIVSLMATAGFDLLTSTLTSSSASFRNFLCSFNNEVLRSPPFTDVTNVNLPISAPSRWRRIGWHCNDFIRLYRQRAWALWDGDEGRPRLPSVDEYAELYGPGPVDGLVGWGLESDDTRNERICHGKGVRMYPSLLGRMVPFWKCFDEV